MHNVTLYLMDKKVHLTGFEVAGIWGFVKLYIIEKWQGRKYMKLTMEKIVQGQEEVIIRYREMTSEVETIACIVQGTGQKLTGLVEGERVLLSPEEIFYLESVDGITWAYLEDKVCRLGETLVELAAFWAGRGFFRCSKSMVLNIHRISRLKSEPGNRILATMENGEQVMISRKYAGQLSQILRGGTEGEE